jgi:hypothetical protein
MATKQCPICGVFRFILGRNKVLRKTQQHFPLIPRFKWMFKARTLCKLMRWYHGNKNQDGYVRHVVDSKAWAHIDLVWPQFAIDANNLKLGLALDRINPFGKQSTTWSTWPIFILNYNLPPWLTTKKFFLMLTLLIPGKSLVKSCNIDVYMVPLLKELQLL